MFPKILYLIGSAFCAQTPAHSFFINGEKLPLCARETGVYLGSFVAFLFWLFKIRKKASSPIFPHFLFWPIIFSVLYFIFDGLSSIFGKIWVSNFTRLFSGLFFGQSLAILILFITSHSLSPNKKTKVKFISFFEFLSLSAINLAIFLIFFLNLNWFLYLAGYLIILSLILTIFLINFAFLLTLFPPKIASLQTKIFFIIISFILVFFEFGILISLRVTLRA